MTSDEACCTRTGITVERSTHLLVDLLGNILAADKGLALVVHACDGFEAARAVPTVLAPKDVIRVETSKRGACPLGSDVAECAGITESLGETMKQLKVGLAIALGHSRTIAPLHPTARARDRSGFLNVRTGRQQVRDTRALALALGGLGGKHVGTDQQVKCLKTLAHRALVRLCDGGILTPDHTCLDVGN